MPEQARHVVARGTRVRGACLAGFLLCLATPGVAEVFKWVDGQGRTHYSERKPEAAREKAVEVDIKAPPPSAGRADAPASNWGNPAQWPSNVPRPGPFPTAASAPPQQPKALSDGRSDDSSASKCNLARDVLSGAVRRRKDFGRPGPVPNDSHDRQVAESDVQLFCTK